MSGTRVLFVCMGNICRSPMAQGILEHLAKQQGLEAKVQVDSAGIAPWNAGRAPDARAVAEAASHGIDLSAQRARVVASADFSEFDYMLAVDDQVYRELAGMRPRGCRARLFRFTDFAPQLGLTEVPDPYEAEEDGFAEVFRIIEACVEGLLAEIMRSMRKQPRS